MPASIRGRRLNRTNVIVRCQNTFDKFGTSFELRSPQRLSDTSAAKGAHGESSQEIAHALAMSRYVFRRRLLIERISCSDQ
jgi:hypothetical protein